MKGYLTIRTDSSTANIALYDETNKVIAEHSWDAGKELSRTLLSEILSLIQKNSLALKNIEGIVVFKGPGSFTGLRIGMTIANTLAYSEHIPLIATNDEDWQRSGIKKLQNGENDKITTPFYGGDANITQPRK